jgi:hypothetical protein
MAGKATSCYLSIVDRTNHKTVFRKTFFRASDLREYLKTITEEYPADKFEYVKETY